MTHTQHEALMMMLEVARGYFNSHPRNCSCRLCKLYEKYTADAHALLAELERVGLAPFRATEPSPQSGGERP